MSQISKDKFYAGWLYINLDEYDILIELGVFGPMVYEPFLWDDPGYSVIKNSKQGYASSCYCTGETLLKLEEYFHDWWEANYIHYNDGGMRNYPHFSEVSKEWLQKRHWKNEPKL